MVSNNNRKVAKYRKPFRINIGVVVFFIMFLYIIIQSIIYLNKDHLAIYEVLEKSIADDNTYKGIVTREETVINSTSEGYINYYLKDSDKVAKNSIACTVDSDGSVYDLLANGESPIKITGNDITSLRTEIANFKNCFNNYNYNEVANLKYEAQNLMLELTTTQLTSDLDLVLSNTTNTKNNNLNIIKTPASGIISYSFDNMEDLSESQITEKDFKKDDYFRKQLRTRKSIKVGSPVYKLVTGEDWNITIQLNDIQYNKLKDEKSVKVVLLKDGITTKTNIVSYKKGTSYFARLSFDKYMVRYINDRYLDIEIIMNSAKGLKIPKTSLVRKDFYKVPLKFFTEGNSSESGVLIENFDKKKNEKVFIFTKAELYDKDENYGYINMDTLKPGTTIRAVETNETFSLGEKVSIEGVYNVNKGYSVFRKIDKIYENQEYCIIKDDTLYGLSVYDHIILNSNMAKDQTIIY